MNLKYNFFTSSDVSKLAIDVEFIPHLPVHLPLTQSDGDDAKDVQLGLVKQVHKKPFTASVDGRVALLAFCTEVCVCGVGGV